METISTHELLHYSIAKHKTGMGESRKNAVVNEPSPCVLLSKFAAKVDELFLAPIFYRTFGQFISISFIGREGKRGKK